MPETPDAYAAIAELAHQHAGRLYHIARRLCGSHHEAEDLLQDVFLQALRKWHTFRGESSETTWLYRIAARACARMHRRRAGEPERIASLDIALPFEEPRLGVAPIGGADALDDAVRVEARQRLEAAIASLPEEFRMPLVLKEIVGLPVAEVAAVLGLAEGTVRSRLHRARLKLREAVDGALPRSDLELPPPAYDERTCLDLLNAKQEALDRGVRFDDAVICERCRSVFATLDLAQDLCRDLASGGIPEDVLRRLRARLDREAGEQRIPESRGSGA